VEKRKENNMEEELQDSEKNCKGVPFKEGYDPRRNYDGRPPDTPESKMIKKATKELISEYKEALGESLPLIKPVLIAKALEGDMTAIKEIHDRVMDKAVQKNETDLTSGGEKIMGINYIVPKD
jgi:hypothetical protein